MSFNYFSMNNIKLKVKFPFIIMVNGLGSLLDILVNRYYWDDIEILREVRVILGFNIMACWEFFKVWKEKIKWILCYYLLRMMEMEEEYFGERFYIYYIKIDVRFFFFNFIIILDNKDINKLFSLSFYIDIMMEDEGIEDIENEGNLKNF